MTLSSPRLPNLLGALAIGVTDRMRSELEAEAGVSWSGCAALLSIGTRPGTSVDALARVVGISHSATVRVVDQLVTLGWVSRSRGTPDGRRLELQLTKRGRRVADRLVEVRQASLAAVIGTVNKAESDALERILTRLLSELPSNREQARHICRLCDHRDCVGEHCPVGSAVTD